MCKLRTADFHTSLPVKLDQVYLVRDDSMFYRGVSNNMRQSFVNILQKYVDCQVIMFSADDQIKFVEKDIKNKGCYDIIISLDKWYKGDFQLKISRNFTTSCHNKHDNFIIENFFEFQSFVSRHTKNGSNILIVDDDISTGGTFQYVKNLIIKILSVTNVTIHSYDMAQQFKEANFGIYKNLKIYDIVDFRDFVPYSEYSGLMVDGERSLYKHPKVDLVHRMKLKSIDDAMSFTSDWYDVKRKVEIGHFYCDQRLEDISIDYLDNFKFSDHDELILFIDDYSTEKRILNIEQLVCLVEARLQRKILVIYESEMLKYSNQTLEYLYANFIIKESSGPTLDKIKLKRYDKPTCFLLSLTWTLFRSGYFQDKEFDVLTIISTRYQKLENKVYEYLPDTIKKRVEYIFF